MSKPLRVVFVCVENSCRSQMAQGFARALGGNAVEAYSAGSRPSGKVNATAIQVMAELGPAFAIDHHASKSLADLPPVDFDAAVTMGCGDACPMLRCKRRVDWQIPDPKHMPLEEFRQVRDRIRTEVQQLLASL
ncbi:MAG TPA: arsenate reductase ArsC [Phycisphaerales bacterium]|nr:arsenate reductase ArsC [Phycisphaerales bacterium]